MIPFRVLPDPYSIPRIPDKLPLHSPAPPSRQPPLSFEQSGSMIQRDLKPAPGKPPCQRSPSPNDHRPGTTSHHLHSSLYQFHRIIFIWLQRHFIKENVPAILRDQVSCAYPQHKLRISIRKHVLTDPFFTISTRRSKASSAFMPRTRRPTVPFPAGQSTTLCAAFVGTTGACGRYHPDDI